MAALGAGQLFLLSFSFYWFKNTSPGSDYGFIETIVPVSFGGNFTTAQSRLTREVDMMDSLKKQYLAQVTDKYVKGEIGREVSCAMQQNLALE